MMQKPRTVLISLLIAVSICPLAAFAKRGVPKPVPPVLQDGVEYRATHARMGFVEAIDTASGRKLWETRVYYVFIDPFGERDVQDVFITSLRVEAGSLLVRNEAGRTYRLDLRTGHVEGSIWHWVPLFCVGSALVFAAVFIWIRVASGQQRAPPNAGSAGAPPASVS
jgi:hypothetical protein